MPIEALFFTHGWGATGEIWQPLTARLVHGGAVLAPTLKRWQADWLAAQLRALPLAATLAVGWSLGGMLLLEAMALCGLQPAGLVLVGVPVRFCRCPDFPHGHPPAAVRALRQAVKRDPKGVLNQFARQSLAPGEEPFWPEVRTFFPAHQEGDFLAAGLDYLLKQDLRPLLPHIAGEITIIQGEADPIVGREQAVFFKEHLPGARLILLPGAGHIPFFTQSAAVAEILNDILKKGPGNPVLP